jgi:hypothetical protein
MVLGDKFLQCFHVPILNPHSTTVFFLAMTTADALKGCEHCTDV